MVVRIIRIRVGKNSTVLLMEYKSTFAKLNLRGSNSWIQNRVLSYAKTHRWLDTFQTHSNSVFVDWFDGGLDTQEIFDDLNVRCGVAG